MDCKRIIKEIHIHCSDTYETQNIGVKEINKWHVEERGWSEIGYHYIIRLNGDIEIGRDINKIPASIKNHNKYAIAVCYIGGKGSNGKPKDTRTDEQKESMNRLIIELRKEFPNAKLYGHCDLANKSCPCIPTLHEEYGY